tara:strand:+ start:220 stop:429 length:210 start_codon:yes stop_codon:yes gene_type:complete
MSKTLYYRETDPNTKKAKWVKLEGVTGNNFMIFINKDKLLKRQRWEKTQEFDWQIVYKSSKEYKVRGLK